MLLHVESRKLNSCEVELSQKCSKDVKDKKRYEHTKHVKRRKSWCFNMIPNISKSSNDVQKPFFFPNFPTTLMQTFSPFLQVWRKQIPWVPLGSHGVRGHLRDLCWRPSLSGGCCLLERLKKKTPQGTMVFNLFDAVKSIWTILWLNMIKVL